MKPKPKNLRVLRASVVNPSERIQEFLPPETRIAALDRDYRNMGMMTFGEPPSFDTIMGTLAALEQEINR